MLLQLDREKQAEALMTELASIISRYRGPLLESSVDLEQRLWHLATMTGEVSKAGREGVLSVGPVAQQYHVNEFVVQCRSDDVAGTQFVVHAIAIIAAGLTVICHVTRSAIVSRASHYLA